MDKTERDIRKEFTLIFQSDNPIRLDKFLSKELNTISRNQIQQLIRDGNVFVDGKVPHKTGYSLEKKGISIKVLIPEPKPIDITPEKIPLDVIYEDNNVVVVNKPAGMVSHPSAGHDRGTLVHAILGHTQFPDGIGGKMRPGIVHRLDKNTSGVIIIAKNDHALEWLQKEFKHRRVDKEYVALVDNHPPTSSGKIDAPIYRDRQNRKKMAIAPKDKGKSAITFFQVIRDYRRHALLSAKPKTGRTHQIRVHLSSIGCPIVGDTTYGYKSPTLDISRHFLHAQSIQIRLPDQKTRSEFTAKMPDELDSILKRILV